MTTHLHFIGIAGSFMSGLARLSLELGYQISGSDRAYYPPMGGEARKLNAPLYDGYDADCAERPADLYIVGNAIARGNPLMESVMRRRRPYMSGPQWLFEQVLTKRTVVAVAGTHGKTTTASLLTYILEKAGMAPGFLLGGVEHNFGVTARLSADSSFFVVEADEYDTAFFDKRPKFMHYRPSVAVLNNLEFDHADIYPTMRELTRQFHYFLRTLPDNGRIIARAAEANIADAVRLGAYAPIEWIGRQKQQAWSWRYRDGEMCVYRRNEECCRLSPPLPGAANRDNMLAAIAAAAALGADAEKMPDYLRGYLPPLRRMQKIGEVNGARIFDDFAHHPTAIKKTIAALAETRPARGRIIAVFEPRSNSMKAGVFEKQLAGALAGADVVVACGRMAWLKPALERCPQPVFVEADANATAERIFSEARDGDDILLMSNGDFDGLAEQLKQGDEKQRERRQRQERRQGQ